MKENTNYNDVFSSVWLERMRKKKWRKKLITRNKSFKFSFHSIQILKFSLLFHFLSFNPNGGLKVLNEKCLMFRKTKSFMAQPQIIHSKH